MNLNKLNDEEVKILINEIKYFLGHVQLQIPTAPILVFGT